ncbi:hypothetical protein AK24_04885 [Listeria monocytogenes]|nr:hypothetical protein [Listeria monocytogenes]
MNLSEVAIMLKKYIGDKNSTQGEFMDELLRNLFDESEADNYPYLDLETGEARLSRIFSGDKKNGMSKTAASFFLSNLDMKKAADFIDSNLKGDSIVALASEIDASSVIFQSSEVSEKCVELIVKALQQIANKTRKKVAVEDKLKLSDIQLASIRVNNDGTFSINNEIKKIFDDLPVPIDIDAEELKYIQALLSAYAEKNSCEYTDSKELPAKHLNDLKTQRKNFYKAESIRRGIRDNFTPDEGIEHFSVLKEDMFDGIEDTYQSDYENGYLRLKAVLKQSSIITLNGSVLSFIPGILSNSTKKGICHMLVNDGRLNWVFEDE